MGQESETTLPVYSIYYLLRGVALIIYLVFNIIGKVVVETGANLLANQDRDALMITLVFKMKLR